ncbi:MAG TPA: TIM-barrel domain-containing protein [Pyrinomonadaceae bacterium]|nr:TIM-barrel domain-containing protein [Pyrinomonadaceae bacterium]
MRTKLFTCLLIVVALATQTAAQQRRVFEGTRFVLPSTKLKSSRVLRLNNLFYEIGRSRTFPTKDEFGTPTPAEIARGWTKTSQMPNGPAITASITRDRDNFNISFKAPSDSGISGWGFSIDSLPDEYYTGLMERVVDGPQAKSWAAGITEAMNLRGQKVDMIIKPTTSIYAPFYISSRGYAVFVKGNWPGEFDLAASGSQSVQIKFEGPSLELKIYTASDPATLVREHALDAGPPFLPPKWIYTPWRWRDEHTQRTTYYDGTAVTGPFNSEIMEDVLMMRAFGIPNGVYWIDRPWGPGKPWGYDDFDIDENRLPHFARMVKWLDGNDTKTVLWIAPFFQGKMMQEALAKGYTLAGQVRPSNGNNYPMVDLTNPAARAYWQEGVAKLLKLGVAGFKMDRAEEDIPESGPYKVFDGRTIRENRNAYPPMYVKAVYEIAQKYRGNDIALMPRAAYTGSSPYAVFWGGDIGGTQEGLRASIIAVQRSAVMGYPNWGSDICGYNQQLLEQEVCGRWLAFGALNPIMEVGPTRNVAFWNLPREPNYDTHLIAMWRMYARLHQRLIDYSYAHAREATKTGMPIVRPLFLIDPNASAAWSNWWTYLYGRDLLVSPVWEKGKREQQVYLPAGQRWRDAWDPSKVYRGGQTITVPAEMHQLPLFVRVGATVELGDLNREWKESLDIAEKKPDLKKLEGELKAWFDRHK